jgi:signal transduction histidine kinase/ActR/RegA family two-component response regulator
VVVAGVALAYAAIAWLSLYLASPGTFASPMFPAAGVALACVLRFGPVAAIGVFAGSFASNAGWAQVLGHTGAATWSLPLVFALGAAAQSLLAATLARRLAGDEPTLDDARTVLRFFLGAAFVGCLVSATVAVAGAALLGDVPRGGLATMWWTWWSGDALGTVVAAPIVLSLIGRPRDAWLPRRLTVALPLAAAMLLLTSASLQIARWDTQRARAGFERDALPAALAIRGHFERHLDALTALQGLYAGPAEVSRAHFGAAAAPWLQQLPSLQALGWHERIARGDTAHLERIRMADGRPRFEVFEREAGLTASDADWIAMRFIEPGAGNDAALGVNALSIAQARIAIRDAQALGAAVASAGFRLTQERGEQTGVVVYRPVPGTSAAGAASGPRGMLFATVRMDDALARASASLPRGLAACLIDRSDGGRRLAGAAGCDRLVGERQRLSMPIDYARRDWLLEITTADTAAGAHTPPGFERGAAQLFALAGVVATALLGAMLMVLTGGARRVSEAARASQHELERERVHLVDAERSRTQAESANRAKSDFLSRMSHELRTPLNAILGFGQLLGLDRKAPLQPRQQQWVEQIQQAGWHLLRMIDDILDLSRVESGTLRLRIEAVRLPALIDAALAMIGPQAAEKQVELQPSAACADAPDVLADATRLRQVLLNLLSNAVKYNRDGGTVRIECGVVDGMVALTVIDDGLGMSAEQVARLFTPFERLGRESSGIPGTGIGLVITKLLIEHMGGSLSVQSTPGSGSRFTLRLPAAQARARDAERGLPALPPDARYRHRLVVMIEDNEANTEVVRGLLAPRPQVTLETYREGAEGLAAVRRLRPDLVLLDLDLPDIDGLAVLARLQHDEDTHAIPVIVISASVMPQQVDAALAAGAAEFLTKPISASRFWQVIDAALSAVPTRFG